jgi:hypothetical protein
LEVSSTGLEDVQCQLRLDMVNEQVSRFHHKGSEAAERTSAIV